jgi:hypothetical protein
MGDMAGSDCNCTVDPGFVVRQAAAGTKRMGGGGGDGGGGGETGYDVRPFHETKTVTRRGNAVCSA